MTTFSLSTVDLIKFTGKGATISWRILILAGLSILDWLLVLL